ncbi:putative methylase YubD, partial [Clarias magur]
QTNSSLNRLVPRPCLIARLPQQPTASMLGWLVTQTSHHLTASVQKRPITHLTGLFKHSVVQTLDRLITSSPCDSATSSCDRLEGRLPNHLGTSSLNSLLM